MIYFGGQLLALIQAFILLLEEYAGWGG